MNTHKHRCITRYFTISCILFLLTACGKTEDWLNIKRNKADVLPASLSDLQAIMDNDIYMNNNYPVLGLVGTDNFYIPDNRMGSASRAGRNAYIWAKDIYEGGFAPEFSNPYQKIAYANIVLERLDLVDVTANNKIEWENVKGQALFIRSFCNYYLANLFCKAYDSLTAVTDPGLPLRVISDPSIHVGRSALRQTYQHMINDAMMATELLPVIPQYGTRASKVAAYALLAKIYLNMQVYDQSLKFAELCLAAKGDLLDYNSDLVQPGSTYRFPSYLNAGGNPEIIFFAQGYGTSEVTAGSGVAFADPQLYSTYEENDLRKSLFFRQHANGLMEPMGRYSGNNRLFAGMSLNEVYFIRMECKARSDNPAAAMADLNMLLRKRYVTNTFTDISESDTEKVLQLILNERRKELALHTLSRWEDLRRLNKEPRFAVTLSRNSNGSTYALAPNDKRYVFPIPLDEIRLNGIEQNER
jgi:hypothetical protein